MSILMPSNTTDFKTLANKVVDEHVKAGKSIEDCVVEIADRHDFTPEEIKRLVEKSNTELSLRHLRGDNKKENFALAKFENVLKRTHGTGDDEAESEGTDDWTSNDDNAPEGQEKTASRTRYVGGSVLPYTRKSAADSVRFGIDKTAELVVARGPAEFDSGQWYAIKESYEKAKMEKAATEFKIQENFAWLVDNVRRSKDQELTKFASDVTIANRGRRPQVLLKHIGAAAGRGDLNKYATERPSYTDDSDEAVRRISCIYSDIEKFRKLAESVEQHETVIRLGEAAIKRLSR